MFLNNSAVRMSNFIILFSINSLHIGEMINIKAKDIDFNEGKYEGKIFLKKRKRHGSGAVRVDTKFLPTLKDYIDKRELSKTDYLFSTRLNDKETGKPKPYT